MTKKIHEVEAVEFDGEVMVLRADGKSYRIKVASVSTRLAKAAAGARNFYRVSPSGYGIHWPEVDEDLSVDGLIRAATERAETEPFGMMREEPPPGAG